VIPSDEGPDDENARKPNQNRIISIVGAYRIAAGGSIAAANRQQEGDDSHVQNSR